MRNATTRSTCPLPFPLETRYGKRHVRVGVGKVGSLSTGIKVKLMLAEKSQQLDLSECQLTEIPESVFELENLTDLSLSGNQLRHLPTEISRLSQLRRLQLAGNELQELPEEIGALKELQGLWVHGNFLGRIPESIGDLKALEKCSLSGNRLTTLPGTLSKVSSLVELEAAGNYLSELPDLEGLERLRKLILHGNRLTQLTESVLFCMSLHSLSLQGNDVQGIASPFCFFPQGLKSLNLAENRLSTFAFDVQNLTNLEHLTLYGNQIRTLPAELMELPRLKTLWLEGNPLDGSTLERVTVKKPITVGLDQHHLESLRNRLPASMMVSFSEVPNPYKRGYFKLVKGVADASAELLVVAFGSAPGTPNWGSVLRRAKERSLTHAQEAEGLQKKQTSNKDCADELDASALSFDVLFVVDPRRSWYGAGSEEFQSYATTLHQICHPYPRCLMIGDSMGATAALMFSNMATSVLAFCPQTDLKSASIRPSTSSSEWSAVTDQITTSVQHTTASLQVVTGTWSHDLDQIDTHRLTAYLEQNQMLVPFIRKTIEQELLDSHRPI